MLKMAESTSERVTTRNDDCIQKIWEAIWIDDLHHLVGHGGATPTAHVIARAQSDEQTAVAGEYYIVSIRLRDTLPGRITSRKLAASATQ